jgi:hypothetical protein
MAQCNPAYHAPADPWIPGGQADDRMPMDCSVRNSDEVLLCTGVCPATPSIDVQEVGASETRLTKIEHRNDYGERNPEISPASRNPIYNNRIVVFGYSFSRASTVMRPR